MKKIILLFLLLFNFLYSLQFGEGIYKVSNNCCAVGATSSHVDYKYEYTSDEFWWNKNRFSKSCSNIEGKLYTDYEKYYHQDKLGVDTYNCGCPSGQVDVNGTCSFPSCDYNETRVNGECYPTNPFDCKLNYGQDWIISDIDNVDSCNNAVDGINYTSSHWNTDSTVSYTPTCCLQPVKPSFDCYTLGNGWQESAVDESTPCDSWVDGINTDSSYTVYDSTQYSNTCCTHNIRPPRPDTNNSTPPPDLNTTEGGNIQAHGDANIAHQDSNNINNSINTASNQAHQDSNNINNSINTASNQAHDDAYQQQTSLNHIGSTLDTISEQQTTLGNQAHDDASSILDSLNQDDDNRDGEDSSHNSDVASAVSSLVDGYSSGLSDIKQSILGLVSPTVSYAGSCNLSASFYNQDVSLNDMLSTPLQYFKPFLLVLLNLIFLFYLFKLTVHVFRDLLVWFNAFLEGFN